ncbi:MAG: cupredoxin domain-containing protein, partial [Dehalococcoidia bacterium]
MRVVALPLLALFVFLMTACEAPGIPHPLAAQTQNNTPVALTPEPSPEPSPTEEPEPLQDTVQMSLKDFFLDPDEVTAKAGTITFVLKNEGRFTHDFRVEGQGIDEKAPKVGRGRTREWQITLEPGIYDISCPISN